MDAALEMSGRYRKPFTGCGTVVYMSTVTCISGSALTTCLGGLPRFGLGFRASLE